MNEIIAKINEENQKIGKRFAWTILAIIPMGIIGLVYTPVLIIGIIFLVYRFNKIKGERKQLNIYVKETVVNHYLANAFQNVTYEPTAGFDAALIERTGLFKMGNRFYSNDLINAVYKDIPFSHADVLIQDVDKSDNDTRVKVLFEGKILSFDFPKKTDVHLQVRENGKEKIPMSKFSWQGVDMEKIQMENEEFNKKFTIYSTSQQEAFYVLTPQVMERIIKIEKIVNGSIVLGIVDNRLYIGLNTGEDTFESDGASGFDIDKIEDDMRKLVSFVELIGEIIEKSSLLKG